MKDRDYYLGQISAMFFALDGQFPVKPEVDWCIERTAKILDEIYDSLHRTVRDEDEKIQ